MENPIIFDQHVLSVICHHASIDTLLSLCLVSSSTKKAVNSIYPKELLKQLQRDLERVRRSGLSLKEVIFQHPDICLAALEQSSFALLFVKNPTHDMVLKAVQQNSSLFVTAIKIQSREICLAAVRRDGMLLAYVIDKTHEICLEAIRQCPYALQYVDVQTPELCTVAYLKNNNVLYLIEDKSMIHIPDIKNEFCNQINKKHDSRVGYRPGF